MQILGTKDKVEKPIVKANGISIAAVVVENQVGDIASCMFQIPPEYSSSFSPGKVVDVTVNSESANGTLFRGLVAGNSFSNTTGSINCRIDLVHEDSYKLDNASTLFPGNMPGSSSDNEAFIKAKDTGAGEAIKAGDTVLDFILHDNFGNDLKEFCKNYITSASKKSDNGIETPYGGQEIITAINNILSHTGQIKNKAAVQSGISLDINQALKSASSSSTFWNVLSSFLSTIELLFVCRLDGKIMLLPNFSGVKSSGEKIPGLVIKFDQSSKYERTPAEVQILVSELPCPEGKGLKNINNINGHYVLTNKPALASGTFSLEAPPFLRNMTQNTSGANKKILDDFAKSVAVRETAKFNMCNVMCPLVLGVFPGVPVEFTYSSTVKTFYGQPASFQKKFDGYCWKIIHEITTQGFPTTTFNLSNVTDGSFDKMDSHPFWDGYTIPKWLT